MSSNDNDRAYLTKLIEEELDKYGPADYGLPAELDKDVWWEIQRSYTQENSDRIIEQSEDIPGRPDWEFLAHEAAIEFEGYLKQTERMSLTVPVYVPYLVRSLAEGPRQMGDALTALVVAACSRKPEPQGILERIEARLSALESRLQGA